MNSCYRTGGCGPYEMYSCEECPASKPIYKCKNCKQFPVCHSTWKDGCFSMVCENWRYLKEYFNTIKEYEEEKKKVKVTKMKKNIPSKVKEEKEEVNSCPACTLKEYKSKTKFAYSFANNFHVSVQEDEQIQFYIGKDNSTNEWMLSISYHNVDYDLSEINREFTVPIKYCPVCGRELE